MVDKKTIDIQDKDNPAYGQIMLISKSFEFSNSFMFNKYSDYNGFWGRPVEAIGVRLFSFQIYFADRFCSKFILRKHREC